MRNGCSLHFIAREPIQRDEVAFPRLLLANGKVMAWVQPGLPHCLSGTHLIICLPIYLFTELEFLLQQPRVWHYVRHWDRVISQRDVTGGTRQEPERGFLPCTNMALLNRWDNQAPKVQTLLHETTPGVSTIARAIGCEKRRISEAWSSWRSLPGGGTWSRNLRERAEEGRHHSRCWSYHLSTIHLPPLYGALPWPGPQPLSRGHSLSLPSTPVPTLPCSSIIHFKLIAKYFKHIKYGK